jgi:hypothetical protein
MCWKSVGRVLNDPQPLPARKVKHRIHIAGQTAEMDGHDRLATWGKFALSIGEIDQVSSGLNVDEHDLGTEITDYLRGRGEGQRRHDHAVAWSDAAGLRREM